VQADLWGQFAHDPRDLAHATLRASDHDRDLVRGVLSAAYADGRLDRAEFDERSDVVGTARTLGELPGIVDDLVAVTASPALAGGGLALRPEALAAQAVRRYESDRREALAGLLGPSLICVVIWALTSGFGGFFWPGFVIAGTGIHLIRTLVRRQDIIDEHARRLEKKQLRAIEKQQPRAPERPGTDAPDPEDPA